MNFLAAIERQNAIASLAKWEEFLEAVRNIKPPKYEPYVKPKNQIEEVEEI